MEMVQLFLDERRGDLIYCVGIKEQQIFQAFLGSPQSSLFTKNCKTPLIQILPPGSTIPHHPHYSHVRMKEPNDPGERHSEKNLPFRKRSHKHLLTDQYDQSSSQSSEVPLNLQSDKTEYIDAEKMLISNAAETQDSSDASSSHNTEPEQHEERSRTCFCARCQQKFGNLPLLAQAVGHREESGCGDTQEEDEETLIPLTVDSLPSTSTSYTKKAPLTCDHCRKEFHHKGDMNKHLRTHTKEQPYKCKYCGTRFSHTSNLSRHIRIHTGSKPFSCTNCDKSFSRADKLQLHQKSRLCRKN